MLSNGRVSVILCYRDVKEVCRPEGHDYKLTRNNLWLFLSVANGYGRAVGPEYVGSRRPQIVFRVVADHALVVQELVFQRHLLVVDVQHQTSGIFIVHGQPETLKTNKTPPVCVKTSVAARVSGRNVQSA